MHDHFMGTGRRWAALAVWLALATACLAFGAQAQDLEVRATLPVPGGEVLLIIEGAVAHRNHPDGAHLDMEMIERLPRHTVYTTTAVTDGVKRFDGFLMRDVLGLVGAKGSTVGASALNGYAVVIPMSDFHDYDVLLATHMDGQRLRVSDKGPFWIVYPRTDWRTLQDIRYDYRWVWQLNRLTVQ